MSLNLTAAGLADQKAWEAAGYALPSYDREAVMTTRLAGGMFSP